MRVAVRVGKPVQVDAEELRTQPPEEPFRIEPVAAHHEKGEVDDAHAVA